MHPPPLDRVEQKVVESLAWHVTRLLDTTDPWCPWSELSLYIMMTSEGRERVTRRHGNCMQETLTCQCARRAMLKSICGLDFLGTDRFRRWCMHGMWRWYVEGLEATSGRKPMHACSSYSPSSSSPSHAAESPCIFCFDRRTTMQRSNRLIPHSENYSLAGRPCMVRARISTSECNRVNIAIPFHSIPTSCRSRTPPQRRRDPHVRTTRRLIFSNPY
jgi:hypothetical protein